MTIDLPDDLVVLIKRYNEGKQPIGSIASLNAVAYIGERICAMVAAKKPDDESKGKAP